MRSGVRGGAVRRRGRLASSGRLLVGRRKGPTVVLAEVQYGKPRNLHVSIHPHESASAESWCPQGEGSRTRWRTENVCSLRVADFDLLLASLPVYYTPIPLKPEAAPRRPLRAISPAN